MKPITILSAICLLLAQTGKAQFFNKLKQKAQSAVTNAVTGNSNQQVSTSGGSSATGNNSSATSSGFDASKYGTPSFTLEAGERIVYGEATLSIINNLTLIKVITAKDRQYYLYENGTRKGPFNTPPVDKLDNWRSNGDYYNSNDKETNWQPYVVKGILSVDGKSYGEYLQLTKFYHNKAKKRFYGVGVKMEQNAMAVYLVSDKGARKIPLPTEQLLISDNDELGGVIVNATQYNAKTPEETYKIITNDDFYVLLSNGKTLGPFAAVQASQSWLDNNGNLIQVSNSRKAVFINGNQLAAFGDSMNGDGKAFVNSNGKSGAWFERGNLYFTDGTQIIDYALQPAVSVENGKEVLNWLSIQNKQVYVCKKDL
ncbi:hypothetical protein ACFQZX_16265 [Mucilaginibacter litoreus]|uniref:WG containing repeat-containing protein n=1 Tax=Mucilaginibacter litoreus TaxID=1048221 RepID=A0ABW3AXB5_9SPHI